MRPPRLIEPEREVENWRAESALFLLSRKNGEKRAVEAAPVKAPEAADLFG